MSFEQEKRGLAEYMRETQGEALRDIDKVELLKTKETREAYWKEELAMQQKQWHNKVLHGSILKSSR